MQEDIFVNPVNGSLGVEAHQEQHFSLPPGDPDALLEDGLCLYDGSSFPGPEMVVGQEMMRLRQVRDAFRYNRSSALPRVDKSEIGRYAPG